MKFGIHKELLLIFFLNTKFCQLPTQTGRIGRILEVKGYQKIFCVRSLFANWVLGWMDGWMDRWMDGWTDGWMDGLMDGLMNRQMDGWMDGWTDGGMD